MIYPYHEQHVYTQIMNHMCIYPDHEPHVYIPRPWTTCIYSDYEPHVYTQTMKQRDRILEALLRSPLIPTPYMGQNYLDFYSSLYFEAGSPCSPSWLWTWDYLSWHHKCRGWKCWPPFLAQWWLLSDASCLFLSFVEMRSQSICSCVCFLSVTILCVRSNHGASHRILLWSRL